MRWLARLIVAFLRNNRRLTASIAFTILLPLALVTAITSFVATTDYTRDDQVDVLMGSAQVSISANRTTTSAKELEHLNATMRAIRQPDGYRIHVLDAQVENSKRVIAVIANLNNPVFHNMYGLIRGELSDERVALTSAAAKQMSLSVGETINIGTQKFEVGAIIGSHIPQYDFEVYIPPKLAEQMGPWQESQVTWYFSQITELEMLDAQNLGFGIFTRELAGQDDQFPHSTTSNLVPILLCVSWFLVGALGTIHSQKLRRLDNQLYSLGVSASKRTTLRIGIYAVLAIGSSVVAIATGLAFGWLSVRFQARNLGAFWPHFRPAWPITLVFASLTLITLILVAARSTLSDKYKQRAVPAPSWIDKLPFAGRLAFYEIGAYSRRFIASTSAISLLIAGITISSLFLHTAVYSAQRTSWLMPLPENSVRVDVSGAPTANQISLLEAQTGSRATEFSWLGYPAGGVVTASYLSTATLECVHTKMLNETTYKIDLTDCQALTKKNALVQAVGTASSESVQLLLNLTLTSDQIKAFESGVALCTGPCPEGKSLSLRSFDGSHVTADIPMIRIGDQNSWGLPAVWISERASARLGLVPGAPAPLTEDVPALEPNPGMVSIFLTPESVLTVDEDTARVTANGIFKNKILKIEGSKVGLQAEPLRQAITAVNTTSLIIFTLLSLLLFQAIAQSVSVRNKQLQELGVPNRIRYRIDCYTNLLALTPALLIGFSAGWMVAFALTKTLIGAPLQFSLNAPIISVLIGVTLALTTPLLHINKVEDPNLKRRRT